MLPTLSAESEKYAGKNAGPLATALAGGGSAAIDVWDLTESTSLYVAEPLVRCGRLTRAVRLP